MSSLCGNPAYQSEKNRLSYLLPVADSTGTFLSVPTSELVSDLRCFHRSHTNLTEFVALCVDRHHYLKQGGHLKLVIQVDKHIHFLPKAGRALKVSHPG